jgi:hypothetical protein
MYAMKKKTCMFLGASIVVSAFIAQHAKAYPATSIIVGAVSTPSFTRIDNRSYRHCHNRPPHVYCYTRKPGGHETHVRDRSTHSETEIPDHSYGWHHRHRHGGLPWRD